MYLNFFPWSGIKLLAMYFSDLFSVQEPLPAARSLKSGKSILSLLALSCIMPLFVWSVLFKFQDGWQNVKCRAESSAEGASRNVWRAVGDCSDRTHDGLLTLWSQPWIILAPIEPGLPKAVKIEIRRPRRAATKMSAAVARTAAAATLQEDGAWSLPRNTRQEQWIE